MDQKLPLLLITSDFEHKVQLVNRISNLQLFEIDTVANSTEAIAKLKSNNYQFIISDIDIGQVDGWCLSSLIRSDIYICDRKSLSCCSRKPTVNESPKPLQSRLVSTRF